MTYFTYQSRRLGRAQDVYDGEALIGRVTRKPDRVGRLRLTGVFEDRFVAATPDGRPLPEAFVSKHDAAEALVRGVTS